MEFCPRCGTILTPILQGKGPQDTFLVKCKKCGYSNREADEKLELHKFQHTPKQMVAVIEKEQEVSTDQTIPFECPNCGNNLAYVWQVQTRSADEAATQFLRCTNCGYTTREYS